MPITSSDTAHEIADGWRSHQQTETGWPRRHAFHKETLAFHWPRAFPASAGLYSLIGLSESYTGIQRRVKSYGAAKVWARLPFLINQKPCWFITTVTLHWFGAGRLSLPLMLFSRLGEIWGKTFTRYFLLSSRWPWLLLLCSAVSPIP